MTEPAFLVMGDLHLDPLIWRSYRQITGDAFNAFRQITSMAIDRHLPLVLAGDVFDVVDPDPWILREFRLEMNRLAEAYVDVYVFQGNHDRRRTPWTAAVHDHPRYIGDGHPVVIGGLTCQAYDYDTRDNIQKKLLSLSEAITGGARAPQVVMLHQAVKQALRFEGQWNCDLEWVPEQVPLVVMGDIHKEWSATVRPGQRAYYTGASHPRDLSQLGDKSCMLVNQDLTVERLRITGRSILAQQVTEERDVEELAAWAAAAVGRRYPLTPVAFVKHRPEFSGRVAEIQREFDRSLYLINEIVTEETAAPTTEEMSVTATLDVPTLLAKLVDPVAEPEAHRLVLELLQSQDSVAEVIRNRREHYNATPVV